MSTYQGTKGNIISSVQEKIDVHIEKVQDLQHRMCSKMPAPINCINS